MRDPSLIFVPELVRPIYATHPEDDGPDAVRSRVIEDILFCRALRAPIWAVEIQICTFVDAGAIAVGPNVAPAFSSNNEVVECAVHLTCRGIDQARRTRGRTYLLQQVHRSSDIDIEIRFRIIDARCHRHLSSQMKNVIGTLDNAP